MGVIYSADDLQWDGQWLSIVADGLQWGWFIWSIMDHNGDGPWWGSTMDIMPSYPYGWWGGL